ncbi:MAG: hypothetical protein HWD61_15145 [Parachlamydiaceae bacterium]|nr:MAG: hypothetical protein HWD61_15145 [Parachlamydiaceae bacterium]
MTYDQRDKSKVKVFGATDLQEVVNELVKKNPNQPIVIAPLPVMQEKIMKMFTAMPQVWKRLLIYLFNSNHPLFR